MNNDEENAEGFPPFNWERLFRVLLIAGLALWVLAGAVKTVLFVYFVDGSLIYTGSERAGEAVVVLSQVSTLIEGIAFRVWVASGILLALLWLRRRVAQGSS